MKATVTIEQADKWLTEVTLRRPKSFGESEHPLSAVASFVVAPLADGLMLRVVMASGGTADLFLNAVIATGLRASIRACGSAGHWLDGEDAIIVSTPSGPARWHPQA
jgi:hypothetical protein